MLTRLLEKTLIALGALLVLLPISPLYQTQPARDSGVFLYIGWRMLHGEVPYLQLWDHKPPVVFFINALGLLLADESVWGVWVLEFVLLCSAALIGFTLVKRLLGSLPAVFSLTLWLLTLTFVIGNGNHVSEYALVLQFAALWLAVEAEEKGYFFWRSYLIGIVCALAFFTRQNAIGIGLAIVLYLAVSRLWTRQYRALLYALLAILLGALTVTALLLLYFGLTGALAEFWDSAFAYNFVYIDNPDQMRFGGRLRGLRTVNRTGLAQFAIAGWVAGLNLFIFKKDIGPRYKGPLAIALLAMPLEFYLVGISGRGYNHYFMAWLPVFSIFAALAFWLILSKINTLTENKWAGLFFTITVLILLLFTPASDYYWEAQNYFDPSDLRITARIQELTDESDSVLLWGNEVSYNFSARWVSPSRFIYQVPLYTAGYADRNKIEEFLLDVIANKPALLIDTGNSRTPLYQFDATSAKIEESLAYLRAHYQRSEEIGGWTLYEYVQNP